MRTYISVDMEGITGAAVSKHVQPGEKEFDRFRRLMTQEVNAAIEGALAGGATDVVVSDGHGPMTNVMVEELHPGARLISGSNKSSASWKASIAALTRPCSSATTSAKAAGTAS